MRYTTIKKLAALMLSLVLVVQTGHLAFAEEIEVTDAQPVETTIDTTQETTTQDSQAQPISEDSAPEQAVDNEGGSETTEINDEAQTDESGATTAEQTEAASPDESAAQDISGDPELQEGIKVVDEQSQNQNTESESPAENATWMCTVDPQVADVDSGAPSTDQSSDVSEPTLAVQDEVLEDASLSSNEAEDGTATETPTESDPSIEASTQEQDANEQSTTEESDSQTDEVAPESSANDKANIDDSQTPTSEQVEEVNQADTVAEEAAGCSSAELATATGGVQTDDGSTLETEKDVDTSIEIINTNDVKVLNEAASSGTSGDNAIMSDGHGDDAEITSGDVNVFANVLTVVNTSSINSRIDSIIQNFNNLANDLVLSNPDATPSEMTQGLVSQVCTEITCKSLSTFNLSNRNVAEVENDVNVFGHSGRNSLQNIDEGGLIRSGNVNALVNILNIVNTNLLNSRWTIATINVFGDFTGDLVLPSELYFNGSMSVGATDGAVVNEEQIRKIIFDINNQNHVDIENNINVDTDSGNNSLEATGTPDGKKGDITDNSGITTGDSQGLSNVKNFLNTNIVNARWYIGMVNTLGNWAGNVFSLPDEVAMAQTPTGLAFFSSTAKEGQSQALEAFKEATAQLSDVAEEHIAVTNDNDARIVNNVDLGAYSGENGIRAEELEGAQIQTGHTFGLANILNFANTNLINADLHVGLINIFGSWNGNIHFGFPDLVVNSIEAPESFSGRQGDVMNYHLSYSNLGDASAAGAGLDWNYDPALLDFIGTKPASGATIVQPGVVHFDLGRLAPRTTTTIDLGMRLLQAVSQPTSMTSFARLTSLVPEQNQDNNERRITTSLLPTSQNTPSGSQGDYEEQIPADNNQSSTGDNESNNGSQNGSQQNNGTNGGTVSNNDQQNSVGQNNNQPTGNSSGSNTAGSSNNSGSTGNSASNYSYYQPNNTSGSGGGLHSLLTVSSSSTAGNRPVHVGDTVTYTLIVSNDGPTDLYNVQATDELRGPDGVVIERHDYPINTLLSHEQVEITYDIEITENALPGIYSDTLYADGINSQLQPVHSQSNAITYFTIEQQSSGTAIVANASGGAETTNINEIANNTEASSAALETNQPDNNPSSSSSPSQQAGEGGATQPKSAVLGISTSKPRVTSGTLKDVQTSIVNATTTKLGNLSIGTATQQSSNGNLLESLATTAQAQAIDIPSALTLIGDGSQAPVGAASQLFNFIAIAFLMAFGYALASVKEKFKKVKRTY